MKGDRFQFKQRLRGFDTKKSQLMIQIKNHCLDFFKNRVFAAQGFISNGWRQWKRRKDGGNWPILEKTGRGRQSIHAERSGDTVSVAAGRDYMNYHNTGTSKMPKRQWLGSSLTLSREIREKVSKFMDSIMK